METCIQLPHQKFCFDLGRCPWDATKLPNVFFTHTHTDHMGGIVIHVATRALKSAGVPTYYMPTEKVEDVKAVLTAWRKVDGAPMPCNIVGVSPGDEFPVSQNRFIRAFRAVHTTPALGYALIHRRKKLKPEYVGRPGAEIGALRQGGTEVTDDHDKVELVFCGDTTIDVLDREPWIYEAETLILEMTFVDDRVPRESARKHGHVHLEDVLDRAHLFQNTNLLFTHFSSRYKRVDIEEAFKRLPEMHPEIHALWPER